MKTKTKKKAKTGEATKRKPPKKINFDTHESSDNAQEEEREEICGTRSDKSDGMSHSLLDNKEELRQLWKKLSPPVPEESVVQQWYGAMYHGKKKSHLYVRKAIRRFLEDVDGPVQGMGLDFP